jgi:eukaryotic-like serine/threonine-protein kinase
VDSIKERLGKTLLGKWHLDALLGEGGMAAVYAATHRNGARGAVKMLHSSEADEISRFGREGYIANHVDHPAIVRALDDDVAEDGTPFLVMELLEGKALDAVASERGGRLPAIEVLSIMREVLDALAAAHDRGIVHRDIKPENIFITTDGRVKVLDFGIAHLPQGTGPRSRKTESGLVMGTPSFMSPEQARARWDLVGPASDVWAVGATMFTLLSGEFVHVEETVPELLAATFSKPARSLRELMPKTPPDVIALVDRALELRTDDRWRSAREMHQALLKVEMAFGKADRGPAPASLASTLPPPRKWALSRRNALLGVFDFASGIAMLAMSVHGLAGRAASAPPVEMIASVEVAEVALPAHRIGVAQSAPSAPTVAASLPPTPVPSSTSTSRDRVTTPRTIYDRRY